MVKRRVTPGIQNEPRGARIQSTVPVLARWMAALLLTTGVSAHALVIGVTEGVTYQATDNQIEARFEPIVVGERHVRGRRPDAHEGQQPAGPPIERELELHRARVPMVPA